MGKHYTDYERYEHCRKYRLSGMSVAEYARVNGINRSTLKDWVSAFNNINGKFINVSTVSNNAGELIDNGAYRANILSEVEKFKKYLNYVFENINKEPIENLLPYSKNIRDKLK